MRLLFVLITSLVVSGAAPAAAEPDGALDTAAVERYVDDYLDRNGLPGAEVAVVKDGDVVHRSGHGEDSDGKPLTSGTRLRIGSVAKSFTAFAVLQLVDEGRIDLDRPVQRYLPDLKIDDARASRITVRQLLSHTSGLPNPTVIGPADSIDEGVGRLNDWKLETRPGTKYAYSNANYWVAADLVQTVRGMPFNDVLRERIFEPLGMDDTQNTITTDRPVRGVERGHVTAYGLAIPATEPTQMAAGSGGMVSTADDMAAWLRMQQRDGVAPDGQRLLSAELIEESHRAQKSAGRTGLGWMRSRSEDPQRVSHSGVIATFNAQQDLVPSSGYGVAVLLNSSSTTREQAYEISGGIIDITEGRDATAGTPVPTVVDLVLGALTLLAAALGLRGVMRSRAWAERRSSRSGWMFALRLTPQLIAPVLAVFVFVVAPRLQDNSLRTRDVFTIFPSGAVALAALATAGLAMVAARSFRRWSRRDVSVTSEAAHA